MVLVTDALHYRCPVGEGSLSVPPRLIAISVAGVPTAAGRDKQFVRARVKSYTGSPCQPLRLRPKKTRLRWMYLGNFTDAWPR